MALCQRSLSSPSRGSSLSPSFFLSPQPNSPMPTQTPVIGNKANAGGIRFSFFPSCSLLKQRWHRPANHPQVRQRAGVVSAVDSWISQPGAAPCPSLQRRAPRALPLVLVAGECATDKPLRFPIKLVAGENDAHGTAARIMAREAARSGLAILLLLLSRITSPPAFRGLQDECRIGSASAEVRRTLNFRSTDSLLSVRREIEEGIERLGSLRGHSLGHCRQQSLLSICSRVCDLELVLGACSMRRRRGRGTCRRGH